MISNDELNKQLKAIGFNRHGWGQGEVNELAHILLPDEEIYECVNGLYEGGFALLVATDIRLLLVDKKPLNFLTVEDLRFDMINEMDYSHRLMGAQISIATGSKNLQFRSYNQARLRKLIGHVQHSMADSKKKESGHRKNQSDHLEKINEQLQAYLMAQHQYQMQLQQGQTSATPPEPIKPSPELSDYLYAQSLLAQHKAQNPQATVEAPKPAVAQAQPGQVPADEIYEDGMKEVFRNQLQPQVQQVAPAKPVAADKPATLRRFEVAPIILAYSKLPMLLRNRKFGFHPTLPGKQASGDKPTKLKLKNAGAK